MLRFGSGRRVRSNVLRDSTADLCGTVATSIADKQSCHRRRHGVDRREDLYTDSPSSMSFSLHGGWELSRIPWSMMLSLRDQLFPVATAF